MKNAVIPPPSPRAELRLAGPAGPRPPAPRIAVRLCEGGARALTEAIVEGFRERPTMRIKALARGVP